MIRRIFFGFLISVTLVGCALFGASLTHAQVDSSDVTVAVTPEHPSPYDSVTITLSSFSTNLAGATVSWTLDGAPKASAIGQTSFTFTAKGSGTQSTVVATVTLADGTPITKTITVTPMGVDILWEAVDSVVPPLYRGKALAGSESMIRFVAMPNIPASKTTITPASTLLYNWKLNYDLDSSQSGYGKNYFNVQNNYLDKSEHVDVEVGGRTGGTNAASSINLTPVTPKVLWYAESPLYGPLFNSVLTGDYAVIGSEAAIIAEPYFFSPNDPTSNKLTYEWTLNGDQVTTQSAPNKLYLHRDNTTPGDATVTVSVKNLSKLFQDATANLTLHLQ